MRSLITLPLLFLLLFSMTVAAQDSIDAIYQQTRKAVSDAETTEEAVSILAGFLNSYPETEFTVRALQQMNRFIVRDLNDVERAVEITRSHLGKINDLQIRKDVLLQLISLYSGQPQHADALKEAISSLETDFNEKPGYSEYLSAIRSALASRQWNFVLECIDKAEPFANEQAVKNQYADRNFTDDVIEEIVTNRRAQLVAFRATSISNLGHKKEAIKLFADAETKLRRNNFLGVPNDNLWLHMGMALADVGELDLAQEKLMLHAMYTRNCSAEAYGKILNIYVSKNQTTTGFDKYLFGLRTRLAKNIGDFELPDYSGTMHSFNELKGKVTIVAFWSPY